MPTRKRRTDRRVTRTGTKTKKGYKRLNHKPYRGMYEHRVVMAKLCSEFCVYPLEGDGLPAGFHVHHVDYDGMHNCPGNLLLLDRRIHDYLNRPMYDVRCPYTGVFMSVEAYNRRLGIR